MKFCKTQLQGNRLCCILCTWARFSQQDNSLRQTIHSLLARLGLTNSPLTLPALLGTPTEGDPSSTQIMLPSCAVTLAESLYKDTGKQTAKTAEQRGRRGKSSPRATQPLTPDSQDRQLTGARLKQNDITIKMPREM